MALEIDIGHLVAGKYELVRLLGRGSMGEVWLARHKTLGEEFAIKFLRAEEIDPDGASSERFLFEARTAARLSKKSRHIVSVTDHGEEASLSYLVMELLEGESLEEQLQRNAPLLFTTTRQIVTQVARGLAQAHAEGIFHRDLKPANIFLCTDDEGQILAKILDFGIARAIRADRARSARSTGRGVILGTPTHMSPEQARALPDLDHRCDLWALSVVAYEALAGELPYEGETIEDVFVAVCTHRLIPIAQKRPDLAPSVVRFFERALHRDVDRRFQTADELADAFGEALHAAVPPASTNAPVPSARAANDRPRQIEAPTQARLAVTMPPRTGAPAKVAGGLTALVGAAVIVVLAGAKLATRSATPSSTTTPPASVAPSSEFSDPPIPSTVSVDVLVRTAAPPADAGPPRATPPPPRVAPRSATNPTVPPTTASAPQVQAAPAHPSPPSAPPQAPPPTAAPPKPVDKSEIF